MLCRFVRDHGLWCPRGLLLGEMLLQGRIHGHIMWRLSRWDRRSRLQFYSQSWAPAVYTALIHLAQYITTEPFSSRVSLHVDIRPHPPHPPTIDPCATVNCGSHGKCFDGDCFCKDFYSGKQCETPPPGCGISRLCLVLFTFFRSNECDDAFIQGPMVSWLCMVANNRPRVLPWPTDPVHQTTVHSRFLYMRTDCAWLSQDDSYRWFASKFEE